MNWAGPGSLTRGARRGKAPSANKGNLGDPLGLVAKLPAEELRLLPSGLPLAGSESAATADGAATAEGSGGMEGEGQRRRRQPPG
jgi:hypothetical protein